MPLAEAPGCLRGELSGFPSLISASDVRPAGTGTAVRTGQNRNRGKPAIPRCAGRFAIHFALIHVSMASITRNDFGARPVRLPKSSLSVAGKALVGKQRRPSGGNVRDASMPRNAVPGYVVKSRGSREAAMKGEVCG